MTKEAFADYRFANTRHTVADGEAGLDYLYQRGGHIEARRPDLILLDLNLPKKHGGEVLKEVKAAKAACHPRCCSNYF